MKKLFGFTLSEVMITLGLLGVLAAMTIPTLTYNYRSRLLESQFRTTYSDIQEIGSFFNNEEGDIGEYALKSSFSKWVSGFMSHISGSKKYRSVTYSKIATYLRKLYKEGGSFGGPYSFGQTRRDKANATIYCDNSGIWTDSKGRIWTFQSEGRVICVDVNGTASPNMYNVDIFAFVPMTAKQVAQWVYGDSADNSSEYTGQFVLCDADAFRNGSNKRDKCSEGPHKAPGQKVTNANTTGCNLDYCPYNWPIENVAPYYTNVVSKNRVGKPVQKGDNYWRDYIQYK